MFADAAALVVGIALAAGGAELFVRGTVGVAAGLRVPAGIIGATVAAFATSSPELTVAVNAALSDQTGLTLGDAMGSNVVNVALVLGIALVFAGTRPDRRDIRRDLPIAVLTPALVGLLILDGDLSRVDGAVLLAVFTGWLATVVLQAKRARDAAPEVLGERRLSRAVAWSGAGLAMLVLSGRLIVVGAEGIVETLAIDSFVVGATVIAAGTSSPEIATTIAARLRGHDEVAVGTILGSNIFNGLWIVGLAGILGPAAVGGTGVAIAIAAGLIATLLAVPGRTWWLAPWRGGALLTVYVAYLVAVVGVSR